MINSQKIEMPEFEKFIKHLRNPLNLSKKTLNKPIIKVIRWISLAGMVLGYIAFICNNWNT